MRRTVVILALVILALAGLYAAGFHRYLTLDDLQQQHGRLLALYSARPALFIGSFMALQITALALCIPGVVLTMALAAGAIFGPAWGTLIVLSSITLGDSLGFLAARYVFRDAFRRRFAERFAPIERGVDEDGAFYLLALRLMAAVPYFVVNVTMALTRMPLRVFAPVSFIGLAPATALYVNAGTALSEIRSADEIVSPRLMIALAGLGLVPLLARLAFKRRAAARAR